jgi:hypothetical protein
MRRSNLFKLVMAMNNYTSPSRVSNKIKFVDMCHDGLSLCNLLIYGIQAWMWWFSSHTKKKLLENPTKFGSSRNTFLNPSFSMTQWLSHVPLCKETSYFLPFQLIKNK